MLASSYPLLNLFLTILWFFLFIIWIYALIAVFTDIFRSHDLGGGGKAVWFIFVLVLPFLGAFVYLIARGATMRDHALKAANDQQAAFRHYVQQAAGDKGGGTADQLAILADLKAKGVLSDAEFESEKAKLLA